MMPQEEAEMGQKAHKRSSSEDSASALWLYAFDPALLICIILKVSKMVTEKGFLKNNQPPVEKSKGSNHCWGPDK